MAAGLSTADVSLRREEFGWNELVEKRERGPARILWEQFCSAMVVLLIVAAIVSLGLQEFIDAAAILAIIALNAALGFAQDYRAEKALAALKRLAVPRVKVRRDAAVQEISAKELVPGDIVLLEVGNMVPADCRLLESVNLRVQEAALTGESEPVEKSVAAIERDELPLGDRSNMVFMGTVVIYGHGQTVVTETGMQTELGHIARSLQTVKRSPTPLQRRLTQLGRTLAVVALIIVGLIFGLGMLQGESPRLMLMTALSMAVAVVPEGLPAVATVVLAIGARRMLKRHALIRKLPAVETLGSVTVICSDKTGTLTENRMSVSVLDVADQRVDLAALTQPETLPATDDDEIKASNSGQDKNVNEQIVRQPGLLLLLAAAGLCNDAELRVSDSSGEFEIIGEPTEAALLLAAARGGLTKPELAKSFPRVGEVAFDSERKRMTTIHQIVREPAVETGQPDEPMSRLLKHLESVEYIAFMKGAVDEVLSACEFVLMDGEPRDMRADRRKRISQANDQMAGSGMRVLGVAFRPLDEAPRSQDQAATERQQIFVGMLGLIDPPRPEVKAAVRRCREAGIRPIMITGDHPLTALHIAQELGVAEMQQVLVGRDISNMSFADLEQAAAQVSVYARVAPRDKLHIVQALQNSGQIVAMTGDGVNDAPALKQAHIGIAMGQVGTDVSKEAADMVLLDDNFATIVGAVEEGRIVYDNIRKFVKYTMTSNAGEVWVMVLGPLMGMPLPLLPLQILWVNLVTDGLPGLALAVEPAERDTMQRPPYPPSESIMGRGMWIDIAWIGFLMGLVSLAIGYVYWSSGTSEESHWRTIIFTVLTFSQLGNALAIRSSRDSLFRIGLLSNKAMLGTVLLTIGLQLCVIYMPPLHKIFKTSPLSFGELSFCVLASAIVFWAVEAQKLFSRWRLR